MPSPGIIRRPGMVPSAFDWREHPAADGQQQDRQEDIDQAGWGANVAEDNYDAPRTPTEQRLAAAFAAVLSVPQDQIGRLDHFFDRGGTSLSAVKLALYLDRVFSLKDLTCHPVLADLAALVGGRSERRAELLQSISESDGNHAGALVCFPYAGGNAVNFRPMAQALRGSGLAVYAVELPGHDVAATSESFAPMAQVVDQVVAEIPSVVCRRSCSGATPPEPHSPSRRRSGCSGPGRMCGGSSSVRSCSVPQRTGAPLSPKSANAATGKSPRG